MDILGILALSLSVKIKCTYHLPRSACHALHACHVLFASLYYMCLALSALKHEA